jgi:anthranilate phosphoribosyltransferase
VLETFIAQLDRSQELTDEQVRLAIEQLTDEAIPVTSKAAFLAALARKGESTREITAFARELRARAVQPVLDGDLGVGEILDVVGTGGDRLGTFNISTTAALLAAAAGARVAKHGNRASTSRIGSADVLEALGIPHDLGPDQAVASLRRHRFAFFFAPKYHPAFRHIIAARKLCAECGQSTIFNFLGPLLNPARPTAMLVGVPRPSLCEPLARVLQSLGVRRAMVVCGLVHDETGTERYLDEISTLGPTSVAEFYQEHALACSTLHPEHFHLRTAALNDLCGGDGETNARIVREILTGRDQGPKRDAVLLNTAAALFVAGQANSLQQGWEQAALAIDSGRAQKKLEELTQPLVNS